MSDTIRKEILPGGITLLTEEMREVRSVCLGVWLRRGSRHETDGENGISHFIEHLVFKGTEGRTAREIAQIIDRFGGNSDAFTGKESTCFFAKVLDRHLDVAVDLLSDVVLRPRFDPEEIEKERKVIFEEIRMVEDTPEELLFDLFADTLWGDHPLGRPIQGTRASVAAMDREAIRRFFRRAYCAENLILSAAGNLSHEGLADLLRRSFADLPAGDGAGITAPPVHRGGRMLREKRELEQVHLCVGVPAFPQTDSRRHAGYLLNTLLGGNMSSRLFQAVREDRGLAYSVYSSLHLFLDTGYLAVYLATAPEQAREALDLLLEELRRFRGAPCTATEFDEAKEHLKGSLMLGLESSSSRMANLARQELYFGRPATLDEVAADIDRVRLDEVVRLAQELLGGGTAAMTAVGPVRAAGLESSPLDLG